MLFHQVLFFNQDLKEANKAAAIEFYKLSNTPKD
tara:strand:+ start:377 stop:478 length:102 start_codon:yes stop_codon:yes gene_type:complete